MDLRMECQGAKTIGISGHYKPDGDCVGACLSLAQYLKKMMPEAQVTVYLEKPAQIFKGIVGYSEIESDCSKDKVFDIYFALDSDGSRLGDACKYFASAKKKINIDHHISNPGSGDVNHIRPQVGSTCEVLFDLMEEELIDKDIAMALYLGIVHDTGVFQYSNTTPETMEKAAKLMRYGFDFSKLVEETFYQKNYAQTQIMGRALMESVRFMDGRCIVSVVDRKTMGFYQVTPKDMDGIVSQLRNIQGVDCAIFMYETDLLEYRVSMRSTEKVDVAEIASYFGGGGHKRAAGCTMKGTFHDCVNNLSFHIEKQLS